MTQEDRYFRPPSEADSFIIRVMHGCSHNKCTFCGMFKDVPLRVLPLEEVLTGIETDARELGEKFLPLLTSLYLEGGDPLALPAPHLLRLMTHARECFPALTRIACYATARSIMAKSTEELVQFSNAGLRRVFMGLESGCDDILSAIHKGCTRTDLVRASQKLALAGIENDVSLMLGIGGPELSRRHALETADLLNAVNPVCVRIRTFIPVADTLMGEECRQGRFVIMDPVGILRELRLMTTHITGSMRFLSEHWSNFVTFDHALPQDKAKVIETIDKALRLPQEAFRLTGIADAIG